MSWLLALIPVALLVIASRARLPRRHGVGVPLRPEQRLSAYLAARGDIDHDPDAVRRVVIGQRLIRSLLARYPEYIGNRPPRPRTPTRAPGPVLRPRLTSRRPVRGRG